MNEFVRVPADSAGKRVKTKIKNNGSEDIHTQVMLLGDRDDPDKQAAVDEAGAMYVRFSDGAPEFDVFGRTTVTELNLMGVYKFYQKEYASQFQKTETGGATVGHSAVNKGLRLTVSAAAGDEASYISHRMYNYRPLNDMPLTWTMNFGDAGKVGLTREFGWFGETDRIVVEEKDGVLNFVIYDALSDITTRVPITSWSHDRLDGAGGTLNLSGADIDLLKGTIWWISFQFLSMGVVQLGVYHKGKKVLCHEEDHFAQLDRPYMSTASLSVGMRMTNTGITSGSSEMRVYCATVTNDGYDDFVHRQMAWNTQKTVSNDTWVPIISYRPSQLDSLGNTNRSRVLTKVISTLGRANDYMLRTDKNVALVGATFANTNRGVEFDTAATAVTFSEDEPLFNRFLAKGVHDNHDLSGVFDIAKNGVTRHYNPATADVVTISARLWDGDTTPTAVGVALTLWAID